MSNSRYLKANESCESWTQKITIWRCFLLYYYVVYVLHTPFSRGSALLPVAGEAAGPSRRRQQRRSAARWRCRLGALCLPRSAGGCPAGGCAAVRGTGKSLHGEGGSAGHLAWNSVTPAFLRGFCCRLYSFWVNTATVKRLRSAVSCSTGAATAWPQK